MPPSSASATPMASCVGATGVCAAFQLVLLFLLLYFVFEHAAGDCTADGADEAVVHLVAGEAACCATCESAHELWN